MTYEPELRKSAHRVRGEDILCTICNSFQPKEAFLKTNKPNKFLYKNKCKDCRSEYDKKRNHETKEYRKQWGIANKDKVRGYYEARDKKNRKSWLVYFRKCESCGSLDTLQRKFKSKVCKKCYNRAYHIKTYDKWLAQSRDRYKSCLLCNDRYNFKDRLSQFCSDSCRNKAKKISAKRQRKRRKGTEAYRMERQRYKQRARDELRDTYLLEKMRQQHQLRGTAIPVELIELKRFQIKLKRNHL